MRSAADAEERARRRAFVVRNTSLVTLPLLPELTLHLATEVTPLWHKTQDWLELEDLEPPYWAFAWPGGQALARFLLDHPNHVKDRAVLDLATGSGLVALAAWKCGARHVTASDIDTVALAAASLNAERNEASLELVADDVTREPWGTAGDVILAGDVFYEESAATGFSRWLEDAADRGLDVFVGDPQRAYLPGHYALCATYDVTVSADVEGRERVRSSVFRVTSRSTPSQRGAQ